MIVWELVPPSPGMLGTKRYLIENTHTWKVHHRLWGWMWWRNIRISIKLRNEIYTCNSRASTVAESSKKNYRRRRRRWKVLLRSLGTAHDFMLLLSFSAEQTSLAKLSRSSEAFAWLRVTPSDEKRHEEHHHARLKSFTRSVCHSAVSSSEDASSMRKMFHYPMVYGK